MSDLEDRLKRLIAGKSLETQKVRKPERRKPLQKNCDNGITDAHILELATKGTVRNREALTRNNYRFLSEAKADDLMEFVDNLVVEFAEHFFSEG